MALLPLEAGNPSLVDMRATAEVTASGFATEEAWAKACVATVQRIGRCVPYPRVESYEIPRRGLALLTVEHRPDAV
jgi:hypothetical protein